ncbi:CBS domain-containing protein, partial [Microcoleus sp. HI-ES]|nr:CBS domain-containing protein [Microcoleus sp. HI-ES]
MKITASGISLAGVAISEVMTENPIAISLDQAGNIFKVLSLLRSKRIRHLPLLDDGGNLLGAITCESIRQILKPADLLKMWRAEEIMTTQVIVTSSSASVLEVAKQMRTQQKSCIVICTDSDNKNQKPVGIITERDIVKF